MPFSTDSTPGIARGARNARTPAQSYGGRYGKRNVSLEGVDPADRRRSRGARPNVRCITALNRRTLPNPAPSATWVRGRPESVIDCLARKTRCTCKTAAGDAPTCRRKRRRQGLLPTPSRDASAWRFVASGPSSAMRRSARLTVAAVPLQAGTPGLISGRQRRHGLNPAEYAAAAVGKKTQFSNRGVRAGQIGREKIPVDKTPVRKRPSNRRSRALTAR